MSIPNLTKDQILTVFMSTRVNEVRLADTPPLLKAEIADPEQRQRVEDVMTITAKGWDIYRDLVQISFYWNGKSFHFLLCDDPAWAHAGMPSIDEPERLVMFFSDEADLVRGVFMFLDEVFGEINGKPMYDRLIVGWRMYSEVWPFLVNRALRYRIPLYREMLVGADSKWPTSRYLGDIGNLYLQGGAGVRKLPGLADLLRFWGYDYDDRVPLPEDMAAAVCEDPVGTAAEVERYLKDMHAVVCLYYGIKAKNTLDPLAGLAVPAAGAVQ